MQDGKTQPAVPMSDVTRDAIRMFDFGSESHRWYDLVDCVDGLTFGFANTPQSGLREFFSLLHADTGGWRALVSRVTDAFTTDSSAWASFQTKANIKDATPTESAVDRGLQKLLISDTAPYAKTVLTEDISTRGEPTATRCKVVGGGRSFLVDNGSWFRQPVALALRDPAIVTFQVRNWERKYLEPAAAEAPAFEFPPVAGTILIAFVKSNSGEVPQDLGRAVQKTGVPPISLSIRGRTWRWDGTDPRPRKGATLSEAAQDLQMWRMMIFWQSMCSERPRIRSRSQGFFATYLADYYVLPAMRGRIPVEAATAQNCDPRHVSLRQ
jgi:hypothetical protein